MKALQQLERHEHQVKQAVLQEIRQPKEHKSLKIVPIFMTMAIVAIITFISFVYFKPNEPIVSTQEEMILHDIQIDQLTARTPYYIATSLEWTGKQDFTVTSYKLLNERGKEVLFEDYQIAVQLFATEDNIIPGVYEVQNLQHIEETEEIIVPAGDRKNILLKVIIGDDFDFSHEYVLQLNGKEKGLLVQLKALNNFTLEQIDDKKFVEQIRLTNNELVAYEQYKKTKDRIVLKDLHPISIMKMYYIAEIEGEKKLQYDLYTKQQDYVMWTFEDQQQFSPFDILSPEDCVEQANLYGQGNFVQTSKTEGTIEAMIKGQLAIFNMMKDDDIWAISYMPIQ